MRKLYLEQCMQIIESILEIHSVFIDIDLKERINLLADCQDGATSIVNVLESDVDSHQHEPIVKWLMKYYEALYEFTQIDKVSLADRENLDHIILTVKNHLEQLEASYYILFLPYKAAMWDSMETVYLAGKKDENVECVVMPLPYFEYDIKKKRWEEKYEGNKFPQTVDIIEIGRLNLERILPDVIYIHNPYDGINTVTSIHPDYYSDKLKFYTKCLVYLPYYVTSGFVAEEHLNLPVYDNMTYMVTQSESTLKAFERTSFYGKVKALGSPKFDKIISMTNKVEDIPSPLDDKIGSRRSLMLNTSIGSILRYGISYLKKIKYTFKLSLNYDELVLVWRPHPLLETTLKAMRPELLDDYYNLKAYFIEYNVGIFDESTDISLTINAVDGYIGEQESSVINLFFASGKPIFIIDSFINHLSHKTKAPFIISYMEWYKERGWFTVQGMNGLFALDMESKKMEYIGRNKAAFKWVQAYQGLIKHGDLIIMAPRFSDRILTYNIVNKELSLLPVYEDGENMLCSGVAAFKDKFFLLPYDGKGIYEYSLGENQWKIHNKCIDELTDFMPRVIPKTYGYDIQEKVLWVCNINTNRLLEFDMETSQYKIHQVGNQKNRYSSVWADQDGIWLAEINTGDIYKLSPVTYRTEKFDAPENFFNWKNVADRKIAYSDLSGNKGYILATPAFSKHMVRLDKKSGKMDFIAKDFFDQKNDKDSFLSRRNVVGLMCKHYKGNKFIVQRLYDAAIAIVDIEEDLVERIDFDFSVENMEALEGDSKGFEKINDVSVFCRRENAIYTLDRYFKDMVMHELDSVENIQKEAFKNISSNIDGSAGEDIHRFIMNHLREGS